MSKKEILRAGYDDIRNNQVGGERDGISLEVAEDLGLTTPDKLAEVVFKTTSLKSLRRKKGLSEKTKRKRRLEEARARDHADPWGR